MKQVPDAEEWLTVNADTHHKIACALLSPQSCFSGAGSSRSRHCRPGWPLLYLSSSSAASALQPQDPGKWTVLKQGEHRSNQLLEGPPFHIVSMAQRSRLLPLCPLNCSVPTGHFRALHSDALQQFYVSTLQTQAAKSKG